MEPEVGKCYRYKTNKFELGKFLEKKEVVTTPAYHGIAGEPYTSISYKFQKGDRGPIIVSQIEESSCESNAKGGKRKGKKTRKARKSRKGTRRHK